MSELPYRLEYPTRVKCPHCGRVWGIDYSRDECPFCHEMVYVKDSNCCDNCEQLVPYEEMKGYSWCKKCRDEWEKKQEGK